ncbi:MAG: glycosyltransferase family 2 protein [Candidatus Dojkabacteria bacterium]|nr:MAG: glycosyltransferase family 2 protein [Candidatus Dojkabacteria bacterium]
MSYIARLSRNAVRYLRAHGLKASARKSKSVLDRWLGVGTDIVDITQSKYKDWVNEVESKNTQVAAVAQDIKISILMPVYNVSPNYLVEAVDSIKTQSYTNWELCIVDDASTNSEIPPLIEKLEAEDERVKVQFSPVNRHISETTNTAFDLSTGSYLLLMDNDDLIAPGALEELVVGIEANPGADLIYFDEDKLDVSGARVEPFFKPGPSPEFLLSMMYPTHALYSRDIFEKAGKLRKGYEGSQDYDLCLRVFDLTDKIYHIPKILYHWRKIPGSTADSVEHKPYVIAAAKRSITESFERKGYKAEVIGDNYPFKANIEIKGNPQVDIIIPTKDKKGLLSRCVESIIEKSSYGNLKIHIVDNNSEEEETLEYLEEIQERDNRVKVAEYSKPFNFSAINNWAVKQSVADYILFLNNDTEVIEPRWIEEMLMWAQMEKIGAVGAKLLFPDHTIQHAGVILGLGPDVNDGHRPVAAHAFYKEREGSPRAFNQMNLVRNYSAVTGACMMIKRTKFDEVGGFDEENLKVNYNDVDLCLKLLQAGYRNVYTAHARLFHHESASRIKEPPKMETEFMRDKWKKYIENDPYYNPNFARNTVHSFII